jgi:hypothetical protein
MIWSEEQFKARIIARAAELGLSLAQLLKNAGLNNDTFYKEPVSGRRLDTFLKLAAGCHWSLAEVLGLSLIGRIDLELSKKAFLTAQRLMARLPRAAESPELLIEAHAYIYDALAARRRDGLDVNDATLNNYVEILARAWEDAPRRTLRPIDEP